MMAELIRDSIAIGGASLAFLGLWLIYPPIALLAGGVAMVATAWFMATTAVQKEKRDD